MSGREVDVKDMTPPERDLYADLVRSAARATARGVAPDDVISVMVAALVKESSSQGMTDFTTLVDGVKMAVMCLTGGAG